jgi:glycosyltransferase involved in cell wall biosynthesis
VVPDRGPFEESEALDASQCLPPTSSESLRLSVLVPVYNEAQTIAVVLRRVLELGSVVEEIVVVDDGSTDGTAEAVHSLAAQESRIRFYRLERNQGKTAAIRHALEQAQGNVVIIQDADLEYDPAEIVDVIAPIRDGHADVVYGSRFLVRRAARVLYFYHYLANRGLTFLSNLLTNRNMTDIETCYKAFRAGVIGPLRLTSHGFGMEIELTAMICKTRARSYEVPISYYGRSYEEGKKIGITDGIMAIFYILYYNLIKPWLPSGREYVRQVNDFLTGTNPHAVGERNSLPGGAHAAVGDRPGTPAAPGAWGVANSPAEVHAARSEHTQA